MAIVWGASALGRVAFGEELVKLHLLQVLLARRRRQETARAVVDHAVDLGVIRCDRAETVLGHGVILGFVHFEDRHTASKDRRRKNDHHVRGGLCNTSWRSSHTSCKPTSLSHRV